jgi:hypothetical protein
MDLAMPAKRQPLSRPRRAPITPEMLELFGHGLAILEAGDDERWEDDPRPGRRREYLDIDKRLNIVLLRKAWHEVSVLEPMLDHRMPAYVKTLASGRDWHISVSQRQALLHEMARTPSGSSDN